MNDTLITQQGQSIECLSGGTHEISCMLKLKRTLTQFICKDGGIRVNCRTERIAIESHDHLTAEQLRQVNKILRNNEVYAIYSCIKGIEHVKTSFRPIRGLPEYLR